jgi:hypothetical protein
MEVVKMKAFLLFQKLYRKNGDVEVHHVGVILTKSLKDVAEILKGELKHDESGECFVRIPRDCFTIKGKEVVNLMEINFLEYQIGPLRLWILPEVDSHLDIYVHELPLLSKDDYF